MHSNINSKIRMGLKNVSKLIDAEQKKNIALHVNHPPLIIQQGTATSLGGASSRQEGAIARAAPH
jgi:hypothetical protein